MEIAKALLELYYTALNLLTYKRMKRKHPHFISLAFTLVFFNTIYGQDHIITIFDETPESNIYNGMQQIITANWPVSYVSPLLLKFKPLRPRAVDLQFGEGQKGYILEGVTDLQFLLGQGRPTHNHFWQTLRFTLRYAPAVRMTFDNSSNLLPTNQKIGLQFDKVLWDSYTTNTIFNNRTDALDNEKIDFWTRETTPLHMVYLTGFAMHYSNGQPEGVWYQNDPSFNRNDYIGGDFSTNILSLSGTYTRFYKSLLSINLGYQNDANWFGPFEYINEQQKRYGHHRLTGFVQYLTKPVRHPIRRTATVQGTDGKFYIVDKKWEWKFRAEWEYILGNLDLYPKGNNDKNYRMNTHLFIEGMPLRSRAVGYLFHFYYGRDYFNIRYDDPVFAFMFGVSLKLKKFRNPRFDPDAGRVETNIKPKYIEKYEDKKRSERPSGPAF